MPGVIDRLDMVRDSTAKEGLDKLAIYLAAIAKNTGGVEMNGWKYVQSLVRTGLHKELIKVGDIFIVEKETAMTVRIGTTIEEGTPGITAASVVALTFIDKIGTVHGGDYEFEYDGAEWHYNGVAVDITEYGISVTGTPIRGDVVIIHETTAQMPYVVLGIDQDAPADSQFTHSLTIGAVDVYAEMQFDAKEAIFAFPDGLSAGTYHFTISAQPWYASDVGKTVQFTLTNAIPENGVIVLNNTYNATMIGSTLSVYASCSATTASETVSISEGDDGIDLGAVSSAISGNTNSIQRAYLGNNNFNESAIRQYLNSDKAAGTYWAPKNKWDRPPSWAASAAGLLYGMDPEFVSVIGKVKKRTAKNTVSDGGGYIDTEEKVFLLSRTEVYAGANNNVDEGGPYRYFSEFSDLSSAGTGADSNRTKYRNNVAKYWWLRSPDTGGASHPLHVYPSGTVNYGGATYSYGVAPACCII